MPAIQSLFQSIFPFALVMNPDTGDRNAWVLWIVIAALVVSAGLLVALALTSRKKKKKRRRR